MRSQAQYTIYSLNDVYTGTTAPTNPYTGQLWVDTSQSPPITKVYNGSAWKEQNGTDTLKTNVQTLTTKQATFETNLNGLTSTVSTHTTQISNIGDVVGGNCDDIADLQSDVSSLQQTATEISATVSHKVDESLGDASSSFGWSLTSSGFHIYSNATEVVTITSSGLEVSGKITSTTGQIGGFTINESNLHTGSKTSYSSTTTGVYIGTNGIGLGAGTFYVTSSGSIKATSGTIGGFTLTANYIYGGTIGSDNSVMIGKNYSTSKAIGGSGSLTTWGLILGSKFGVTRYGVVYGSDVHMTGEITATSGTFSNCTIEDTCDIYGYVYMAGSEEVKFYGSKTTMNYESWIGGTGTASEITHTISGTTYTSYSYNRPFGQIIVPAAYSTSADDGMIFGIMETNSFKLQNLLSGCSFYYHNDNSYTTYSAEAIFRAGDKTFLDATWDSSDGYLCYIGYTSGKNIMQGEWYFGEANTTSHIGTFYTSSGSNFYYYGGLYGNWYCVGNLYFREDNSSSGNGYITHTTQNSVVYSYLAGTWYAQEIYHGSYSGYRVRIDGDQVTWYYGTTQLGELESYSSGYVDVQGTWKTNGNNWISSSDRRIKKDILDFDESYETLFDNLKPRQYRYVNGNKGRVHSGFIAQEVSDAVIAAGKTIDENAYVCAFENKEGETYYGLRYEELIALNTWQIQKLKQRIKQLEDKLL